MEKTLEKGSDKIQEICDSLRKETLEPAKLEAKRIVEEAKIKAEEIVREAQVNADSYLKEAKNSIEKERMVFHSSLEQAGKQALEQLRQVVENELFSDELQKVVLEHAASPHVVAKLIAAIVKSLGEQGSAADLSAVIPHAVSPREVNALLGEGILKRLKEKGVVPGQFEGGTQVKLVDRKITIDMTDKTLIDLLSGYVRKDFRKLLFK